MTLRSGQVKARKHHQCMKCDRPIPPGDTYWVRVVLVREPRRREVIADYSCCGRFK